MPKMTFYEGQTATNPSTGEKLMYKGGKWFPATGAAPATGDGLSKTDQEALQSLRDQSQKALGVTQQAERFTKLNEGTGTGGGRNLPVIPLIPKFMGQSPTWGDALNAGNPDWQEMKSISATVGPNMRPPGSGSSSDTDVKLYMSGFPGVDRLGPANQGIEKRLQQQSDQAAARTAFMDTWAKSRGNLLGADQAFNGFWTKRQAGDPVANNIPMKAPVVQGAGWKIVP